MLRFLTSGESHGRALTATVEGIPAGLPLEAAAIDRELSRRQRGYGRGARMRIERDRAEILSGVRHGLTLGSPITVQIENRDWKNWREAMAVEEPPAGAKRRAVTRPRPGHADLAGALKFGTHDARNVLERASARETAARVAVGAIVKVLLAEFGVEVLSHVVAVGPHGHPEGTVIAWRRIAALPEESLLRCCDPDLERRMVQAIDAARRDGDTIGGSFEVVARGAPPGLGSYAQWDQRLDALLARAIVSIPSVKGVEIGEAVAGARRRGSEHHDEIFYRRRSRAFFRETNRAGGIEGGVSNGQEIRLRAYVKPLSTLRKNPKRSVDLETKEPFRAAVERSDTNALLAAGVIGEAVVAITLGERFLAKFGGDSMAEVRRNFAGFRRQLRSF
ncbi:MAG: chorismate synthase [Acidobacteria bacterium]|nr:chorismate synthase [Acidobacteriota bacterium]